MATGNRRFRGTWSGYTQAARNRAQQPSHSSRCAIGAKGTELVTADLSDNFHVYGVTWTKDSLVWSLDDQIIFSTPTPPDMHKPMYLLVNLAVGGSWPGSPDASTHLPANLLVDWIQVKQPEVDNAVQEKGITQ